MASVAEDKDQHDDPAPHKDEDHGDKVCTYCEALKVPEKERTPGMRTIIKQEKLQLEVGKLMTDYLRLRRLVEAAMSQGVGVHLFGQSDGVLMKVTLNIV